MPPLNSINANSDEVIEIQHHLVHLNVDQHPHHTLVESISALLHGGSGGTNGSHPGSGNGLSYSTGESGVSEDLLIVICTLIPLLLTVVLIFIIAVAIRKVKMHRAESLQEVVRRTEFKMTSRSNSSNSKPISNSSKKVVQTSFSNPMDTSFSKSVPVPPTKVIRINSSPFPAPSPAPIAPSRRLKSQRSVDSSSSSSSNSASTSTSSSSSSSSSISTSPTSTPTPQFNSNTSLYLSQVPPWFLHSTPYYKSQYHLNKLHRQLFYQENLRTLSPHLTHSTSMVSLNSSGSQGVFKGESSHLSSGNSSDPETENEVTSKKKKSKKLKKVFQIINIPKRIRQNRAEKNRFNIYTIPNETREQLKQIYVY